GQAPARSPGAGVPAARRRPDPEGGRPGHRGDQPRPGRRDPAGAVPRGPLLPVKRLRDPGSGPARAARRPAAARRSVSLGALGKSGPPRREALPGREGVSPGTTLARKRPGASQRDRARDPALQREPDHTRELPGARSGATLRPDDRGPEG